jgi:hypothetical protein
MAYDASKDVLVTDIGAANVDAETVLTIGVYAYNGGTPKLRVTRFTAGAGNKTYREAVIKVSLAEWRIIANAVEKAGIL